MSQSSPEGIILGKGSRIVSASLSVNKEKVFEIKETPKTYTESQMHLLMDKYQDYLFNSNDTLPTFKEWFEMFKKSNTTSDAI
jgi:hypothetical protein